MQERPLLSLLMVLNAGLVGACLIFIASSHRPTTSATAPALPPVVPPASPARAILPAPVTVPAAASSLAPRSTTWREVWSPDYPAYLDRVRAAGCPEERVIELVKRDVDDFYAQQRLAAAQAYDHEWWRNDSPPETGAALQMLGRAMAQQRADLLATLLRPAREAVLGPSFWRVVPLTGTALGELPAETHEQVQQICERAQEAEAAARTAWARAQTRAQQRRELAAVLSPEAFEAFLLRYSPEASRLRAEFAPISPSADEFQRAFAAVDPLDQRVALEFGDVSSLSGRQLEQHQRLREAALQRVLSPERFQSLRQHGRLAVAP